MKKWMPNIIKFVAIGLVYGGISWATLHSDIGYHQTSIMDNKAKIELVDNRLREDYVPRYEIIQVQKGINDKLDLILKIVESKY